MDKKEKEVQKALGLLKIYEGYVKVRSTPPYYEVYEVYDVNLAGAEHQIHEIIIGKVSLSLSCVQEKNGSYPNLSGGIHKRHKCK